MASISKYSKKNCIHCKNPHQGIKSSSTRNSYFNWCYTWPRVLGKTDLPQSYKTRVRTQLVFCGSFLSRKKQVNYVIDCVLLKWIKFYQRQRGFLKIDQRRSTTTAARISRSSPSSWSWIPHIRVVQRNQRTVYLWPGADGFNCQQSGTDSHVVARTNTIDKSYIGRRIWRTGLCIALHYVSQRPIVFTVDARNCQSSLSTATVAFGTDSLDLLVPM